MVWPATTGVDATEFSAGIHVPPGSYVGAQVTSSAAGTFDLQGSVDGSVWSVVQAGIVTNAGAGTGIGVYKAGGGATGPSAVFPFPMARLICQTGTGLTVTGWLSAQ
jgi:hypothetical protein